MRDEKEDFEFKPITEGLGFHKKVMELKEDAPQFMAPITGILPKPRPAVTNLPPRGNPVPTTTPLAWTPALKNLKIEEGVDKVLIGRSAVAWAAGIFDAIMVGGLSLLFAALVFALTRVDFFNLGELLVNERGALLAVVVLVTGVYEIYSITCRSFFARTLGEWAFGYRVGTIEEQEELMYPLRVAWRAFLIALTGFIVLPLVSQILGRDIAGVLSGAYLYSETR